MSRNLQKCFELCDCFIHSVTLFKKDIVLLLFNLIFISIIICKIFRINSWIMDWHGLICIDTYTQRAAHILYAQNVHEHKWLKFLPSSHTAVQTCVDAVCDLSSWIFVAKATHDNMSNLIILALHSELNEVISVETKKIPSRFWHH